MHLYFLSASAAQLPAEVFHVNQCSVSPRDWPWSRCCGHTCPEQLQYQSGPTLVTHNGWRQGAARAVPADQFGTLLNSVTSMASQETDLPDAPGADSVQDTEAPRS